jgi:hypothetical protein
MCPTVIYQSDLDCAERITNRLAPYPSNGRQPECTVTTNPTRCITRVYLGGLQAGQPMQPMDDDAPGYSGGGNGYGY